MRKIIFSHKVTDKMLESYKIAVKVIALMPNPTNIIVAGLGVFLLSIFLPQGLTQWESYVPTDPTLALIWVTGAIIIVVGIVMQYLPKK